MKRCLLLFLLLLLLLTGCTRENPEQTQPSSGTQPAETSTKETAPSLYDPQNPLEAQTAGAVTGYLAEACYDLTFMGERPLLFCNDGTGNTRILRLETENYSTETAAVLSGVVYPGQLGFRVTENNLGYYSEADNAVIVLDAMLREVSRIAMPADMSGLPLICMDMETAFYTAGTELRAVDLETGISRPLRQRNCQWMSLQQSIFDDSVLVCGVGLESDVYITEFISAANGETLGSDGKFIAIDAWQDRYFLQRTEGSVWEMLFAQGEEALQAITPRENSGRLQSALAMNALVGVAYGEKDVSLELYDLESGKNTARVSLAGLEDLYSLTADPAGRYLWFFAYDSKGVASLYRWDPAKSSVEDSTVYTKPRYTREAPDTEGLARCRSRADLLEETYGVVIHLEQQMPAVEDYAFDHEFHVQAYLSALEQLEQAMKRFPEDFFVKLGQVSGDGKVHIGLVRDMEGRTANSIPDATGVQYWAGGNAVITLKISSDMAPALYHELAHVMDTLILNEALSFDDWEKLNPDGFSYDENYADYLTREDTQWLEGEDRAFVDAYAMSYPKEDRARIFEYAMQEGNEELFASAILQEKLIRVCKGIRDAFGLKKDERTFPWEQYLEKSLAYQKK